MTKANLQNPYGLTARECEVMESMCRLGKTAFVAQDLGIKQITVQEHLTVIVRKMCVENATLAVLKWDRKMRKKQPMVREAMEFAGKRRVASVWELGLAGSNGGSARL